jgi:predicted dehydrogenase
MRFDRRTFLMMSGGPLVAGVVPSEQISVGVIGSGGRGTFVMSIFLKDPTVRISAICDVYEPNLQNALAEAMKVPGNRPRAYRNYKELLEDKDVQAVLIATPEHWHHRMILDALDAGKDIYVEKPLCQTPEQGVELITAERNSKNIVQVGTQRRSYDLYREGQKLVAAGTLGNVRMVRSWWLNNYLGGSVPQKLEGTLDWEQWQGPAPRRPFDPNRFLNWRLFSDYASGIIGDQGAHIFDGIHLLMNASYPLAVNASAGKPHRAGVDMPESVVVAAEYPQDFLAVFSINYAAMHYEGRNDQLNQLDGDKGRMDIGREECRVYLQGAEDTPVITKRSERGFGYATDLHVRNFLECFRSRKRTTAPMALGFQAALIAQMANLSLRQGRRVRWNAGLSRLE